MRLSTALRLATPEHPREAIEARIGVEPIEDVQHRRRELVEQNKRLAALFGPNGRWEEKRKAYRNIIATEIAGKLLAERGKAPTEAELERLACADPRYRRLLRQAHGGHEQYLINQNEIESLTEIINRDQALTRYVTSEPK
jgi:hypothetical protein